MMHVLFFVPISLEEEVNLDNRQKEIISSICDAFSQAESFSTHDVEQLLRKTLTEKGAKLKDVAHAIRVTVTGSPVGPGLFEMLSTIGRDIAVARLRELLDKR
jgi:glutamyl-tRNA synthetase